MLTRAFDFVRVSRQITLGVKAAIAGSGKSLGIPLRGVVVKTQGAPATATVAATLTAAQLLTGILNATPTATGATAAYTLPTGTLMDNAVDFNINDSFDWVLINNALAALDTITLTASSGHTIVGGPIVQSLHVSTGGITGYSAVFRTRKTAANTFVTYRIG
jgi:hypothetical protein